MIALFDRGIVNNFAKLFLTGVRIFGRSESEVWKTLQYYSNSNTLAAGLSGRSIPSNKSQRSHAH